MKNLLMFSLLLFLLSNQEFSDEKAVHMLKIFYTAYNISWSSTKSNYALIKQIDSLRKKYCVIGLYNNLRKQFKIDGLDHDILINDEYTDSRHIKTITVLKDSPKINSYIVSYIDSTFSPAYKPINKKVILHVMVALEEGQYKIVSVK